MFPAMCGSDTFTTVVSSTSMNVAAITASAINHGLAAARQITGAAKGAEVVEALDMLYSITPKIPISRVKNKAPTVLSAATRMLHAFLKLVPDKNPIPHQK